MGSDAKIGSVGFEPSQPCVCKTFARLFRIDTLILVRRVSSSSGAAHDPLYAHFEETYFSRRTAGTGKPASLS
jgi:hypothetical protein